MMTILVVDDNPNDLFLLTRALSVEKLGHRLVTASDGVEAQHCLQIIAGDANPDPAVVVFTDVNMPRCDGLQFLKWLRTKPAFKRLPVVMLSSFDRATDQNAAFELGAVACVRKPPDANAVEGLVRTLTNICAGRSQLELRTRVDGFATRPAVNIREIQAKYE